MRERLAQLPGVISVAWTDAVPLSGGHRSDGIQVEGKPARPGNRVVDLYMVMTPGYFDAMGIRRIRSEETSSTKAQLLRMDGRGQRAVRAEPPGE